MRTATDDESEPVLRVALLAQQEHLATLVTRELEGIGARVALQRVLDDHEVKDALVAFRANVVLAGASNERRVWRAYSTARRICPSAPFILLTESFDEQWVVGFARYHPDDIVLVANFARLGAAVQVALKQRRPLAKLSPRQLEVLVMIAEGRGTRDIAEKLGLSAKTVESHRGEMMKRLGLHDVASLVRFAVRMGLVLHDSN